MNIGLIAHDSKKKLMQNFCIAYRGILSKHSLYATGTTGRLIEEVTNLNVHKYLAGHLGGGQQMCIDIEQDQLDLVIFLREPVSPKRTDPDGSPGRGEMYPVRGGTDFDDGIHGHRAVCPERTGGETVERRDSVALPFGDRCPG